MNSLASPPRLPAPVDGSPPGRADRPGLTVVYCLAAEVDSPYVLYLVVSAATVRAFHPEIDIVVRVDAARTAWCRRHEHNLRALRVAVLPVSLPPLAPMAASRRLKVQHRRGIGGRCLYLDADAMLVRPLPPWPREVRTVGAVPDRNVRYPSPHVPVAWRSYRRTLRWPALAAYCNSGTILSTGESGPFFERWRVQWEAFRALHSDHDQPSFNAAAAAEPTFRPLGNQWNAMVEVQPWSALRASVVHFFTNGGWVSAASELAYLAARLREVRTIDDDALQSRLHEHRVWCRPPGFRQWCRALAPCAKVRTLVSLVFDWSRTGRRTAAAPV